MTTILILNAISSLLATVGISAYVAHKRRLARKAVLQPIYVTDRTTRSN